MALQDYSQQQWRIYLQALGELLQQDKREYSIMLIGGAVMCFAKGVRASTKDIDYVYMDAECIYDSEDPYLADKISEVAKQFNLDEMWMENSGGHFVVESMLEDVEFFEKLGGLNVYLPSLPTILAMKLLSARIEDDKHDLEDVRWIIKELGIRAEYEALIQVAKEVYNEEYPLLFGNTVQQGRIERFIALL